LGGFGRKVIRGSAPCKKKGVIKASIRTTTGPKKKSRGGVGGPRIGPEKRVDKGVNKKKIEKPIQRGIQLWRERGKVPCSKGKRGYTVQVLSVRPLGGAKDERGNATG